RSVDRLSSVKPLSAPEKRAIETFLSEGVDLDDVIARAGRLLAQLTGQVAVVQYPSLSRSGLRHLELVPVGETRLLVVIITDTGRVEQRTLEVASVADEGRLAEVRARLNAAAAGKRLADLAPALAAVTESFHPDDAPLVRAVGDLVAQTLAEES